MIVAYCIFKGRIVKRKFFLFNFFLTVISGESKDFLRISVIHTLEFFTWTDWPVYGIGVNSENILNVFKKVKRIFCISVHLVDECNDRNITHYTDLEKFDSLFLNTLWTVNYHYGRVCRHKCTVGIFREVLMSRCVKNIYAITVIFKLQNRWCNRNTTLFFNFHPVGHSMLCGSFAFYRTCKVNCSAVEQELFRKCCFTRIRMRNNRKGSALADFFFKWTHIFLPFGG